MLDKDKSVPVFFKLRTDLHLTNFNLNTVLQSLC
jgi:hypothetical protein